MDFGNSVLAGLPVYLVHRLQSVLNAAARLTYHLRQSDHITDASISSLSARASASSVQDFRTDVLQSLARTRATIPWSAQPRCRPAWPLISSFYTDFNRMVMP